MAGRSKWLSHTVSEMSVSAIKEMAIRSAGIEGVASLTWGLPSFRTPEHIRRAVERELEADPEIGKYALPDGLPELRRLVARDHLATTGIEVDPVGFAVAHVEQAFSPSHGDARSRSIRIAAVPAHALVL